MTYVFDTNVFSQLFGSYYSDRFPTLWKKFDDLVKNALITSTWEVLREIEDGSVEDLRSWVKDYKKLFPSPTEQESKFVREIFKNKHFQQLIEKKKLLTGGKNADAFIVARARVIGAAVVTMKKRKKMEPESPISASISGLIACRCMDSWKSRNGVFS